MLHMARKLPCHGMWKKDRVIWLAETDLKPNESLIEFHPWAKKNNSEVTPDLVQ